MVAKSNESISFVLNIYVIFSYCAKSFTKKTLSTNQMLTRSVNIKNLTNGRCVGGKERPEMFSAWLLHQAGNKTKAEYQPSPAQEGRRNLLMRGFWGAFVFIPSGS